jgi:hypothetical protein
MIMMGWFFMCKRVMGVCLCNAWCLVGDAQVDAFDASRLEKEAKPPSDTKFGT